VCLWVTVARAEKAQARRESARAASRACISHREETPREELQAQEDVRGPNGDQGLQR
jgi:hypothetical protein